MSSRQGLLLALLAISLFAACVGSADAATPKAKVGAFCTPSGTAAGQCKATRGIAVNLTGAGGVPAGSVYVVDTTNARVQQFSATGAFIRAFGKEVDETTGGDVCPVGDACKAGTSSAEAGALRANGSYGIAVDQSTGAVYVSSKSNRRIDVFAAVGTFEGALGWNVDAAAPAEELQFCTTATGCTAGVAGEAAGQLSDLEDGGLAVDPLDGDLYVADSGNLRLAEYAIDTDSGGHVTGATFVRALGWNVDAAAPAEEPQVCTTLTGCREGTAGGAPGQFSKGKNPGPIAVDSAGNIYAINVKYTGACTEAEPCNVLKFNPDGTFKELFGPTSGECQLTYTSGTGNAQEAFAIAVDPVLGDGDNHVYVAKKTAAGGYRVYEFDESGGSCVSSPGPNSPALAGTTDLRNSGLAVGDARLYASNGGGEVDLLGEAPAPTAAFGEVTDIGAGGARLTGTVTPPEELEGNTFATTWHFEYSTDQAHWISAPVPDPSAGAVPGVPVPVETMLTGLAPRTTYFARLCAATGPSVCDPSPPIEFATESVGPTVIPFSANVTQTDATLGAEINPNNLPTSYHFEWASPAEWARSPGSYGHRIPARDRELGSGFAPVNVDEALSGLASAGLYHFRVIATNSAGTTASPDQQVETLNSCGMTAGRCLELVSRAAKGPLASPGKRDTGGQQIQFQADPAGSQLAYTVDLGYPDSTAEEEVAYIGRRGPAGWSSEQLSPPSLVSGGANTASKYLSPRLGCGIFASRAPLAAGAPAAAVEAGGANLYRRDAAGSYEVITALPPVNAAEVGIDSFASNGYLVVGSSPDCRRVVFRVQYRYPGVPAVAAAKYQLYEWDHGTLRNVAVIPGPGGAAEPVPAESLPGALDEPGALPIGSKKPTDYWRAVSAGADRSIFTAVSRFGADAGTRAIFLRDATDPAIRAGTVPATDVSQSETATPNDGNSRYWTASTDGKRIFFTARYGLAHNGSSSGATSCANSPGQGSGEGCDLYEYDADAPVGQRLTDLTPDTGDAKGAGVVGVLDATADGSHVYLAARGRLGDAGRTEAENLNAATFNVYLAAGGAFHFVRTIGEAETVGEQGPLITTPFAAGAQRWNARASSDGATLAFETSAGTPGGMPQVYLYSAADSSTICISCRHDGQAPYSAYTLEPLLISAGNTYPVNMLIQPTVLTDDGRLYFYSADPLATGAVEGARNLYQWEHGQVSLIATEPEGVPRSDGRPGFNFFGGASADGNDVYFTSPLALTGSDEDERWDVYDARVGGGFPRPTPPPLPCDATVEGACNPGGAGPPAQGTPATSNFTGPGNPSVKQHKKHHKKKHRHHRKKHRHHKQNKRGHGKKKHKKAGKARRANTDRRAAR